jgi:hypothetical protein
MPLPLQVEAEIPAALKYRFAIVTIVARYLTFAVGTTKNEPHRSNETR